MGPGSLSSRAPLTCPRSTRPASTRASSLAALTAGGPKATRSISADRRRNAGQSRPASPSPPRRDDDRRIERAPGVAEGPGHAGRGSAGGDRKRPLDGFGRGLLVSGADAALRLGEPSAHCDAEAAVGACLRRRRPGSRRWSRRGSARGRMQIDGASHVGDASAALGRDAPEPVHARGDGRPWLGQQRPPAAAERQDRADVVLARQVPQPVRVIERLERAAAALREGERRVDEGQREAADRDHASPRGQALAREPAIDRQDRSSRPGGRLRPAARRRRASGRTCAPASRRPAARPSTTSSARGEDRRSAGLAPERRRSRRRGSDRPGRAAGSRPCPRRHVALSRRGMPAARQAARPGSSGHHMSIWPAAKFIRRYSGCAGS